MRRPTVSSDNGETWVRMNGSYPTSPRKFGSTGSSSKADPELAAVCRNIQEAVYLRKRYRLYDLWTAEETAQPPSETPPYDPFEWEKPGAKAPPKQKFVFEFRKGVMHVWASSEPVKMHQDFECAFKLPPDFATYCRDMGRLLQITQDGPTNSFCYQRLTLLEALFKFHQMQHEQDESAEQSRNPHRDFYNVRKVDAHVHLAAAMNQKHLLRFIKKKIKTEASTPVVLDKKTGKTLTLGEVCDEMKLTPHELSLDHLGMHADTSTFFRFDKFNLKYNPGGESRLRDIFLKSDNHLKGRFFAEITQELFNDLEESKYQHAEFRISVYGRARGEWQGLADWVLDNHLYSDNNRWLVQVPRLYDVYRKAGLLKSFQEVLDNIFLPLFEVTRDPQSNFKLHCFLRQVTGFDSVDDESKPECRPPWSAEAPETPDRWTSNTNPHYSYWAYYLQANVAVLNQMRQARGFNTFSFRPHSGEAGEMNHLHTSYLLADGINHGIQMKKAPVLQYLFYISQIGIAMSPMSNNALFLELVKNPFPMFFKRGLNVSLSTDDPLMFHHTKEPLIEEYCVAKQTWKMTSADMAEAARNSVLQSSFEPCMKAHWLGANYLQDGVSGNDMTRTNVPNIRVKFRQDVHQAEMQLIFEQASGSSAISRQMEVQSPQGKKTSTDVLASAFIPDETSPAPPSPAAPTPAPPSPFDLDNSSQKPAPKPAPLDQPLTVGRPVDPLATEAAAQHNQLARSQPAQFVLLLIGVAIGVGLARTRQ